MRKLLPAVFQVMIRTNIVCVAIATLILSATPFQDPPTGQEARTIKVVNKTDFDIDAIYLSEVDAESWGETILDDEEVLKPGEQVEIDVDCGRWDVRLVAPSDSACVLEDVDICETDTWTILADC